VRANPHAQRHHKVPLFLFLVYLTKKVS
jgi:hypothetical protein